MTATILQLVSAPTYKTKNILIDTLELAPHMLRAMQRFIKMNCLRVQTQAWNNSCSVLLKGLLPPRPNTRNLSYIPNPTGEKRSILNLVD